ncbi:Uncharacterised protein [Staphylococcus petrasii]|uniref:Uncharacterized protein n=1 Tax=Staphylococcus petrasii TaxID=1276936 RepID=A0A380FWE5_9STAP|nr:hypothetical protein [Staphylococcus petrasii]PNZ32158.1 hypothetical protein CD137_01350 [Staphylococcus petrasii]TGE12129.1 hypothetical protein E2557_06530 [Staphylococcus petrasii]TGE15883.1 hypothetical protein BJR09_10525 [Staphylococcus petrasii]SUM42607.1 Uncharacterised protein [Staphylococcus petrasii]
MDGIIAFLQMLVVVPYSIFLLAVFMYCIWKCVLFVNDLIRGLLGNRLQSNGSEGISFLILFVAIFLGSLLFIIPFYIVVMLIGNFFQIPLVIIGIFIIVKKLK